MTSPAKPLDKSVKKRKNMNPFDISFSKSPVENIERYAQIQTVIDAFTADTITNQLFLLTGVRGAGKTVLMNQIANRLEKDRDWIVVRLNNNRRSYEQPPDKSICCFIPDFPWAETSGLFVNDRSV